jgi:hypothetical protein
MGSRSKSSEIHIELGFYIARMPDGVLSWLLHGSGFRVRLPMDGWKQTCWVSFSNWFESHCASIEYPLRADVHFCDKEMLFLLRCDEDLKNLCRFLKDPILLMSEGGDGRETTASRLLAAIKGYRRAE